MSAGRLDKYYLKMPTGQCGPPVAYIFGLKARSGDKFMFTGAGFTSTLCNPLNVLYFLGADLTVDFEVSKLHSVMFITGPPTTKHGIIEPDCTQKTLWRFLSKLFRFPQLLDVSLT